MSDVFFKKKKQVLSADLSDDLLTLRLLELSDCHDRYLFWLNDPNVNSYLETRWISQEVAGIKNFVLEKMEDEYSYLMAIIDNKSEEHIGNIKLGPINIYHKTADVSYFIGDTSYWGKGYASSAIKLMVNFGFSILGLHTIKAGVYESNRGSARALEKSGFQLVGNIPSELRVRDKWENHLLFSILNQNEVL